MTRLLLALLIAVYVPCASASVVLVTLEKRPGWSTVKMETETIDDPVLCKYLAGKFVNARVTAFRKAHCFPA